MPTAPCGSKLTARSNFGALKQAPHGSDMPGRSLFAKLVIEGGLMPDQSLIKATLQLPCSVVIVSAKAENHQGAMTATAMYMSQVPPLIAVSISKTSATYQLIEKSKEFAINVIADNQQHLTKQFGSVHGYEVDKFKESGISTESASKISAPLILGCFANLECQVKNALWEVEGNHAIYIAEVIAFKSNEKLKPVVWLNNQYFEVGTQCQI
jgi:flavin reductase (DIM6/NTAB) family NADH-FMN oxidoreductase RutF